MYTRTHPISLPYWREKADSILTETLAVLYWSTAITIPSLMLWVSFFIILGDYFLEKSLPYANVYDNLSNVIALLEGESGFDDNGDIGSSLVVNCHYDSVPFALGEYLSWTV